MKIYILLNLSEKLLKTGLSEVVISKIVLGIPTTRIIKNIIVNITNQYADVL